jgi:cell wall-associated NlpC family hydrolase
MNFCLIKAAIGKTPPAGSAEPTRSAASSTFRYWSHQVSTGETPKPGDLVVFRNVQSPGYGHVGFFLAEDASRVLVLGGNQFEGTPVRHTVNRKWISKNGGVLQLHSYRTDPQLHS